MKNKNPIKVIKYVNFTNGKVIVSDPCYDYKLIKKCGKIVDVLTGQWKVEVEYSKDISWGLRVGKLKLCHEKYNLAHKDHLISNDIGVDSGQCGIYDYDLYPKGDTGEYDDLNSFYGKACQLTICENGTEEYNTFGIINQKGVVSSSGWGDGCYELWGNCAEDGKYFYLELDFEDHDDGDDEN